MYKSTPGHTIDVFRIKDSAVQLKGDEICRHEVEYDEDDITSWYALVGSEILKWYNNNNIKAAILISGFVLIEIPKNERGWNYLVLSKT